MTIKKHWTSLVFPIILILLGLFCFLILDFWFISKYGGGVLFLIGLYQFFAKKDIEWSINNDTISIHGLNVNAQIPIYNIYECIYEGGELIVRKNDGLNTVFIETNLENALNFSQEVNRKVQNYKKTKNTVHVSNQITDTLLNTTDEILKLNDLREKGIITETEFQLLKNKLIS